MNHFISQSELAMLSRTGNYELKIKRDDEQECWVIHVCEIDRSGNRSEYLLQQARSNTAKSFRIFDTAFLHVLKIVENLDNWTLETPSGTWDAKLRR